MRLANLWLWLPAVVFLIIGVIIQQLIYVHWDVAWLVAESQKFLAGGQYGKEFFDPNPPLILYLYFPIVWLIKYTFLNIIQAIRVYTFLVGIISLLISAPYINKIFLPQENLKRSLLIAVIAFCYFILPTYQFAQREHFILMLSTPYILSVIAIAEQENIQSMWLRILVGIFAGIGFSIKPFYLLTPMITEIYLLIRHKSFTHCFRIENIMLIITVLIYLLSIYGFAANYYSFVLPFVTHFYVGYEKTTPLSLLLTNPGLVCLATLCFSLIICWRYPSSDKVWILMMVTFSYLIFFIVSAKPWYYHAIPMFAFSLILLSICFSIVLTTATRSSLWSILCMVPVIFIAAYAIVQIYTDFELFLYIRSSSDDIATHLIKILKRNPSIKSLYAFSLYPTTSTGPALYGGVDNCSRFTGFWMMPEINRQLQNNLTVTQKTRLDVAVNYIRTAVVEDFQRCKPDLVIVDVAKPKNYFFGLPFDYINFVSANQQFRFIWKNYCYQKTINNHFALYVRCAIASRVRLAPL